MKYQSTSRFVASRLIVAAMAVALPVTASFALGTAEQRSACMPDVFRLCSSEIPSVDRIVACLKKEKTNLSAGCQAVFNHPQEQEATRSLATPESQWCTFDRGVDANQDNWVKWCGSAARIEPRSR
jgi:hypothetical protein